MGHVFQDAFKAVKIENDPQLLWASAYVHQNPAAAELVKDLKDYPWSSYSDYLGIRNGRLCDQSMILGMMENSRDTYKKFVLQSFEKIKERKDLSDLFLD